LLRRFAILTKRMKRRRNRVKENRGRRMTVDYMDY